MPSYLDLGLIVVMVVSALLAMLRGFTREILAIGSWIAAAVAARFLYVYPLPYIKPHISNETIAVIASGAVVFLIALILVSLITVSLSDAILDSKVGALDRSLGFLFGIARGFLLCVVAYVFFSMLSPVDKPPGWMRDARMLPLLQSAGAEIKPLLPRDALNWLNKPKTTNSPEEPPPEGDATDAKGAATTPDADSPAPLPPPRDTSGKEP